MMPFYGDYKPPTKIGRIKLNSTYLRCFVAFNQQAGALNALYGMRLHGLNAIRSTFIAYP